MEYVVETTNLTKVFGNFTAVDKLNIKIKPGEIYGFLGPNGAGKNNGHKDVVWCPGTYRWFR